MERKKKPTRKKHTLKNATSHFFKGVFFSYPKIHLPIFTNLFFSPHGLISNLTMTTFNNNSFGNLNEMDIPALRTDRRVSANSTIKKLAVQCLAGQFLVYLKCSSPNKV